MHKEDRKAKAEYGHEFSKAGLGWVSNPEEAYAEMTRQDYMDYNRDFRDMELDLIEQSQTDTSLIDQAREDVPMAARLTRGIASRNAERYGASLTPAQLREQERQLQLGNTLGGLNAISNARIAQRDANTGLLADLINVGQGVNRSSLQQMGSSAANFRQLQNNYSQAKAQSRAQTYGTVANLASTAIFALAF